MSYIYEFYYSPIEDIQSYLKIIKCTHIVKFCYEGILEVAGRTYLLNSLLTNVNRSPFAQLLQPPHILVKTCLELLCFMKTRMFWLICSWPNTPLALIFLLKIILSVIQCDNPLVIISNSPSLWKTISFFKKYISCQTLLLAKTNWFDMRLFIAFLHINHLYSNIHLSILMSLTVESARDPACLEGYVM